MRVATHDGSFHADEVFALAALTLLDEPLEIVRTRDRELMAGCDLRVDVGFAYDPASGDFDHHQREFSETRPNGIGYASFGLIWREFGARVCGGDAELAAQLDQSLVAAIDANDTGQQVFTTTFEGVRPLTVNGVVGALNPRWDEDLTEDQERTRFDQAVALAAPIIEREVASAASGLRAARLVRQGIAAAADPRLVELADNVPWKSVVVPEAPEALYVIYPKRQGFGLEAVPRELGSFANRQDLPEPWAGLDGPDLAALTGVEDALFCHAKRFLAVARSREGIGELARLALANES
ncbi:MAG TPA: MYG1 family protein [Thermoleophilaceae bacterium]|nr:MYG1 family protein [Thermoleophilaceae bacterium]